MSEYVLMNSLIKWGKREKRLAEQFITFLQRVEII